MANFQPFSYKAFLEQNPDLVAPYLQPEPMGPGLEPPVVEPPPPPATEPVVEPSAPVAPPPPAIAPLQSDFVAPQSLSQVRGQTAASYATQAENYLLEGEAKAQAHSRAAALENASADRNETLIQESENYTSENRERKRQTLSDYERSERILDRPVTLTDGQKTTRMLTSIIGNAALGMGNGPIPQLIAGVMQMIEGKVLGNVYEELQQRDAEGKNQERALKFIEALNADSQNENETTAKVVANELALTSTRLRAVAQEAKSTEERFLANRLAEEARNKARDVMGQYYVQQARARNQAPNWNAMLPSVLEKMEAEGTLPLAGMNVLNDMRKRAKDAKPKEEAPLPPPPVNRQVDNPVIWRSVPESERSKYRSAQSKYESMQRAAGELDKLLDKHGNESFFGPVYEQMRAIHASLAADYKEVKELGALDNGVIAAVNNAFGDPTSFWSSGESTRARLQKTSALLREGMNKKAQQLGLSQSNPSPDDPFSDESPEQANAGAQRAAQAREAQMITLYHPQTGQPERVHVSLEGEYRQLGFTDKKVSDMTDSEYQEYVRRSTGN